MSHIFLRVCWQLLPWWKIGLEMEDLKSKPIMSWGSPVFNYCHSLIEGKGRTQCVKAEILRFKIPAGSITSKFEPSSPPQQQHL